jgi:hypothetical protein
VVLSSWQVLASSSSNPGCMTDSQCRSRTNQCSQTANLVIAITSYQLSRSISLFVSVKLFPVQTPSINVFIICFSGKITAKLFAGPRLVSGLLEPSVSSPVSHRAAKRNHGYYPSHGAHTKPLERAILIQYPGMPRYATLIRQIYVRPASFTVYSRTTPQN